MSHFTIITLKITDQQSLLEALQQMGYADKVEVHPAPVALIGYDNQPRVMDGRTVTAEIANRRQHLWAAANDIGFARQADGMYIAYISEYDRRVQPDWHLRLLQEYGVAKASKELRARGWKVKVQRNQATRQVQVLGVRYA